MPWSLITPNQASDPKRYQALRRNVEEVVSEVECEHLLSESFTLEEPNGVERCSVRLHSYPPDDCHGESGYERYTRWQYTLDTFQGDNREHGEDWGSPDRTSTLEQASKTIKTLRLDVLLNPFSIQFQNSFASSSLPSFSSKAILQAKPNASPSRRSWRHFGVTFLLAFTALLISTPVLLGALALVYGGVPPSYIDVRRQERALPQHRWGRGVQNVRDFISGSGHERERVHGYVNGTAGVDEGDERYLRFPDHLWGHGLNNVLQEALLYALVAHHSNRSYVFEDFVWSHLPLPYTLYDFTLRPTRVPMGAFLGGWTVGQHTGVEEGQRKLQLRDRGKTREDEEERMSGPLIAQVLDVAEWARALCDFQPELQQRRQRRRDGPRPTTTRSQHIVSDAFGSSLRHGNTHREDADGDLALASVPSETRTRPPTLIRSSISAEYFEHVCPPSRRVEVFYTWPSDVAPEDFSSEIGARLDRSRRRVPEATADGADILRWWVERLSRDDVRNKQCVVVREEERRLWDSDFFGTRRPLSLFPILRDSPVLSAFEWSPLVKGAVEKTIARFFSSPHKDLSLEDTLADNITLHKDSIAPNIALSAEGVSDDPAVVPDAVARGDMGVRAGIAYVNLTSGAVKVTADGTMYGQMIQGILAVHLRRGDYKRHCLRLAHWDAGYMGWNRLIEGPPEGGVGFEDGLQHFLMQGDKVPGGGAGEGDTGIDPDLDAEFETVEDSEEWKEERWLRRKEAYYLAHCLPTIPQIVRRLREVREEYEATIERQAQTASTALHSPDVPINEARDATNHRQCLREVYVLTNGWPSFVDELRTALLEDGWQKVVGSADVERGEMQGVVEPGLDVYRQVGHSDQQGGHADVTDRVEGPECPVGLSKEEKGVGAAIDMGLAERAEVFVGNGFSSLSANIVMLRLARGFEVHSNRML